MTIQEVFALLDDINNTDTDFETRRKFAHLVVELVKSSGGIINVNKQ